MCMSEPDTSADAMLRLILTSRVYDVARSTPLDDARRLSQRTGNRVLLKREERQTPELAWQAHAGHREEAVLVVQDCLQVAALRHVGRALQSRRGSRNRSQKEPSFGRPRCMGGGGSTFGATSAAASFFQSASE